MMIENTVPSGTVEGSVLTKVDKGQCLPHVISIWNVGKYKGNMNFTFMRKF